jgi:hypothetical protein
MTIWRLCKNSSTEENIEDSLLHDGNFVQELHIYFSCWYKIKHLHDKGERVMPKMIGHYCRAIKMEPFRLLWVFVFKGDGVPYQITLLTEPYDILISLIYSNLLNLFFNKPPARHCLLNVLGQCLTTVFCNSNNVNGIWLVRECVDPRNDRLL